jgi:hypothetical protein
MHRPGLLPTAVSCARLFSRVERTKVSNSSYARDPRLRGSFRPLAPSCTSKGRSNIIERIKSLNVMHCPGPLLTALSCARLFACVERTKVSNSNYARDPRMRLFPAINFLVHIERKIKHYYSGKFTQRYASPWPIADFCELHASVRMYGEGQHKVSNSSFSHEIPVCGSFRLLAPSVTSK